MTAPSHIYHTIQEKSVNHIELTDLTFVVERCSLFCFYIKPQLSGITVEVYNVVPYSVSTSNHNDERSVMMRSRVVPYSVSTSNHNCKTLRCNLNMLFLILFLHQTTTRPMRLGAHLWLFLILFLHQTTTHGFFFDTDVELFLILFLHQTTTGANEIGVVIGLFLILFLHQTTTGCSEHPSVRCCSLFCFYIKPQH